MMLLFGVVSYKVRPPRLVSNAFLYTTCMCSSDVNANYLIIFYMRCMLSEGRDGTVEIKFSFSDRQLNSIGLRKF